MVCTIFFLHNFSIGHFAVQNLMHEMRATITGSYFSMVKNTFFLLVELFIWNLVTLKTLLRIMISLNTLQALRTKAFKRPRQIACKISENLHWLAKNSVISIWKLRMGVAEPINWTHSFPKQKGFIWLINYCIISKYDEIMMKNNVYFYFNSSSYIFLFFF